MSPNALLCRAARRAFEGTRILPGVDWSELLAQPKALEEFKFMMRTVRQTDGDENHRQCPMEPQAVPLKIMQEAQANGTTHHVLTSF